MVMALHYQHDYGAKSRVNEVVTIWRVRGQLADPRHGWTCLAASFMDRLAWHTLGLCHDATVAVLQGIAGLPQDTRYGEPRDKWLPQYASYELR